MRRRIGTSVTPTAPQAATTGMLSVAIVLRRPAIARALLEPNCSKAGRLESVDRSDPEGAMSGSV